MNTGMMMENGPYDADLVRHLDGELEAEERVSLEAALDSDAELAGSLAELRAASEHFGALLADDDLPAMPDAPDFTASYRRRRVRLLAAAVVVLTGAGLLAVSPVGASLTDGLRAVAAWILGTADNEPTELGPPLDGYGTATVSAAFTGPAFEIVLDHTSLSGTLEVIRSPGDRVSATASAETELVFLRGRLVVRGPSDQETHVTVQVPPSVTTIRISTPDGVARELGLTESAPRAQVALADLFR